MNNHTPPPSQRKSFAEVYCARHQIPAEKFEQAVFKKTLHPMARIFHPLIQALSSGYFQADLDLVRATGRLRRTRDYATEVCEFIHHPDNTGFWRITMGLRISTGRLRHLLRRTLHASPSDPAEQEETDAGETAMPFSIGTSSGDRIPAKRPTTASSH